MRRHLVHTFWAILIFVISFTTIFFVAVWNGWIGYMPDMEELSNPVDKFASQVYSADGKLIGTWNQDNANRVAVDYNSLSPHLVHALVATEDERFTQALTSLRWHVPCLNVAYWGMIKRAVAQPSHSNWQSKCSRKRHTARSNECCRNPLSGLLL